MITTMVHGPDDRLRSYELVADSYGMSAEVTARASRPA